MIRPSRLVCDRIGSCTCTVDVLFCWSVSKSASILYISESAGEKSRKNKSGRGQQQLSQKTTGTDLKRKVDKVKCVNQLSQFAVYDNDPWFTPHSSSATSMVPTIIVPLLPLLTRLRHRISYGNWVHGGAPAGLIICRLRCIFEWKVKDIQRLSAPTDSKPYLIQC